VAAYQEALALDPDSVKIRAALGKALLDLNRPSEAVLYLRVAGDQAPEDAQTAVLLARALHRNGESQEALATLERFPDDYAARFTRGSVLAELGRNAEAATVFRALADSDGHDGGVRLALASALIRSHDTAEGIAVLNAYSKDNPGASETFDVAYLSGLAARQSGDYELAAERLRQAVARDPSHADARYQLGFALARLGEPDDALVHLRKAASLEPNSVETRYQLTTVLRRMGRAEEAEQEAEELTRVKQAEQRSMLTASAMNRAGEAMARGAAAEAVALYQQALEQEPQNAKALYNLALALDATGDAEGKRHSLEQAVAANPSFAPAQHQLALLDLADGNAQQAEARLKLAVEADPTLAEAFNNLGVLCGQTGRPAEASEWLHKAVTIRPAYVDAHRNLGLMLAQKGKLAEATRSLLRARELDPTDPSTQRAIEMLQAGKR
jgi:superkiller protein 3